MRCGMWLSTHRASVKKVWERFYVAEFFYPLSNSHCDIYISRVENLRFLVPGGLAVTVNAPSARKKIMKHICIRWITFLHTIIFTLHSCNIRELSHYYVSMGEGWGLTVQFWGGMGEVATKILWNFIIFVSFLNLYSSTGRWTYIRWKLAAKGEFWKISDIAM